MPIFEYQCTQCGERAEIIQKLSDPPYSHCPKCGGEMKKLFSAPAIQFKGSGWYKTDYASKPAASSAKSETAPESKSESKTETKSSDTKAEAKSETKSDK